MDRIFFICLGVWALLYGVFAVTNLRVEWSVPIMGFAALALGVVCVIRALK
ncbi:MAG: hypothetical protein IMZ57_04085 [Acidobacteria bacterium]|nr:hypothetical protein [Acidobacteriota bacterium]